MNGVRFYHKRLSGMKNARDSLKYLRYIIVFDILRSKLEAIIYGSLKMTCI